MGGHANEIEMVARPRGQSSGCRAHRWWRLGCFRYRVRDRHLPRLWTAKPKSAWLVQTQPSGSTGPGEAR